MRIKKTHLRAAIITLVLVTLTACQAASVEPTAAPTDEVPIDTSSDPTDTDNQPNDTTVSDPAPEEPDGPRQPIGSGDATEGQRSARVVGVTGTAEAQASPDDPFQPLTLGDHLIAVSAVRTGEASALILELDDGTAIYLSQNTEFEIQAMTGDRQSPITRFFLNIGSVFSLRGTSLPDDARYDIETPTGIAAIRGSSMGVTVDAAGQTAVSCLEGRCEASQGDVVVELTGGQAIDIRDDGIDAEPRDISDDEVDTWEDVIFDMEEAETRNPLREACQCDDGDLVCQDGSVTEAFNACEVLILPPSGGGEAPQPPEEPELGANGLPEGCDCDGGDMRCTDGSYWGGAPACNGGTFALPNLNPNDCDCDGNTLVCNDGNFIHPNDEFCINGPPPGGPGDPGEPPPGFCGDGICDGPEPNVNGPDYCEEDCG